MRPHNLEFQRRAVSPWTCLGEGWRLISDQYWLFLGIAFVGLFIGGLAPLGLLLAPAMCGIHLCLLRRESNLPIRFEMLFDGFNYFVPSLIATLVITAPTALLTTFAVVSADVMMVGGILLIVPPPGPGQPPPPSPEIGIVLLCVGGAIILACIVIVGVIQTLTIFVYPLIVDKELPGFEAVKLSYRAVMGNRGGIFGLVVLRVLIDLAASLVCCVGPILVLPLDLAMVAIAYRQVFAADDPFLALEPETPPEDEAPARLPPPSEGITATPGERSK
jgi:hypothetical protein